MAPNRPKKAAKRTPKPKAATTPASKVPKKPKATPKKVVQAPPTPAAPPSGPRPIELLLSLPFLSLTTQEKLRVLLPLLRGMDPRLLEQHLSELPSVQAKGPGAEKVVATTILNSPNDEEADVTLANYLVVPRLRNETPQQVAAYDSVSAGETSPQGVGAQAEGQLGAMRQVDALKKAKVLDALGKRR